MIRLTKIDGRTVFLAPDAIASLATAGASSQWHGIRSYVKSFDGEIYEVQEQAEDIVRQIEAGRKS